VNDYCEPQLGLVQLLRILTNRRLIEHLFFTDQANDEMKILVSSEHSRNNPVVLNEKYGASAVPLENSQINEKGLSLGCWCQGI
jgi:hypothetical protein